ncbi:MAG: OmpW/AlkL family protein [Methyloligella sp. ZOD6]
MTRQFEFNTVRRQLGKGCAIGLLLMAAMLANQGAALAQDKFLSQGMAPQQEPFDNLMIRGFLTGIIPEEDFSAISVNGVNAIPSDSATIDDFLIPTVSLSYFFNENLAVETICCATYHEMKGAGALSGMDIGSSWIVPAAVTFQYHMTRFGKFKPYVGIGPQYFFFLDEDSKALGGDMDIDDGLGLVFQFGFNYDIGNGWTVSADAKKAYFDTDYHIDSTAGDRYRGSVDMDPWLVSVGVGYRFNMGDLF